MCLAIPMRVIEIKEDRVLAPVAIVDSEGISKEVRLDIVDRAPRVGDYLIVHAGYAIHTVDEEEAEKSLALFREIAEKGGG